MDILIKENFLQLYRQLAFFTIHSIYDFREHHSTEHALIDIVNQVQSHFDLGIFSCGVRVFIV